MSSTRNRLVLVRSWVMSSVPFGRAFLWRASPALNLGVATGFGLLGAYYFAAFGRDLGPARK
jgi:hypothetical protein